jgi:hypothetical protein
MKKENRRLDFFLGSNSDNGFVSHFEQLQNPHTELRPYLIKGGPGTGKSSFMKKIGANALEHGEEVEFIHCSSDPDSLDGVFLNQSQIAFVDATPPHVLEPRYPMALERTLNFLEAVDDVKAERHKLDIADTSQIISGFHKKFCQLLKCANVLFDENRKIILPYVDAPKIAATVKRIAKKELRTLPKGTPCEKVRMTSAFTPEGLVTYYDTVKSLCKNLYLIHDEYRVCAPLFLNLLQKELLEKKVSYYLCYSPFHAGSEIDQILIPELGLGFVTANRYLPYQDILSGKTINATRFIDKDIFRKQKQRLSFYRKTAHEVLEEGIKNLRRAKDTHDILESYYIPCVDFSKIDAIYQKLQAHLEKNYQIQI